MHGIFGIHDPGGEHLIREAGRTGWVVCTEAIGHDPNDRSGKDFSGIARDGIKVVCRINNAYGSGGTIPLPQDYEDFARRCANYVQASHGCDWFIIGNEISMEWERPDGKMITLRDYVRCYKLCVDAIKSVRPEAKIMPQAPATWNNQTQYAGNERGDWVKQLSDQLEWAGLANVDGIALHTYSHGHDPALITSEARMGQPFDDRRFHFRTYIDFMDAIPSAFKHLPVFITEADQDEPWLDHNNGWVKAAYQEIDRWNKQGKQQIHCLALYRWPDHDKWTFASKQGVINDFREAMQHDYKPVQQVTGFVDGTGDRPVFFVAAPAGLNLRSDPITGAVLGLLPYGASVNVLERSNPDWWHVQAEAGFGWVAAIYLSKEPVAPSSQNDADGDYITALSAQFGVDSDVIRAVIAVESGGSGFRNGRLLMRFEPHIFKWKLGNERWDSLRLNSVFKMGDPSWDGDKHFHSPDNGMSWMKFHGDQDAEWRVLERAITIDKEAAYQSASYGAPQIMGFNHLNAGYPDAESMVQAFMKSEQAQFEAMFNFMERNGALTKLRAGDYVGFAAIYNGPGQAAHYARLIQQRINR